MAEVLYRLLQIVLLVGLAIGMARGLGFEEGFMTDSIPIDMDDQFQYKNTGNYEIGNREYIKMLRAVFANDLAEAANSCDSSNYDGVAGAAAASGVRDVTDVYTDPTTPVAFVPDRLSPLGSPTTMESIRAALPPPPYVGEVVTISEQSREYPEAVAYPEPIPEAVTKAYKDALQYINIRIDKEIQIVDDELIKYKSLSGGGRGGGYALLMHLVLYREGRYHGKKIGVWVEAGRRSSPRVRDIWIIGIVFEDKIGTFPIDALDPARLRVGAPFIGI